MSADPFNTVKQEIEESVKAIRTSYERWKKLLAEVPNSAEYAAAGQDILQSIADTEADLQDLAETVVVVENNRDRFRIADAELAARRQFLTDTRTELSRIAAEIQSPETKRRAAAAERVALMKKKGFGGNPSRYAKLDEAIAEDNSKFINGQDAMQMQILQRQDEELDALGRSVAVLGNMGKTMSAELAAQGQMLEDLGDEVTQTDTRLGAARRKVDALIQKTKGNCMTVLVWVLIGVLVVLIILIFVV